MTKKITATGFGETVTVNSKRTDATHGVVFQWRWNGAVVLTLSKSYEHAAAKLNSELKAKRITDGWIVEILDDGSTRAV